MTLYKVTTTQTVLVEAKNPKEAFQNSPVVDHSAFMEFEGEFNKSVESIEEPEQ